MAKFAPSRAAWFLKVTMLPPLHRAAMLTRSEELALSRQSTFAAA